MISIPQDSAPTRTRRLTTSGRARLATLLGAALLLTAAAPAAEAATGHGGVSVSSAPASTKTPAKAKAKGASDDPADATPAVRPKSVSKLQLKRAQTLLRVSASGTHDTKTRQVVKRFQRYRGITTSGVVDLTTYLQIKDAFALLETGGASIGDTSTGDDVPATTDADAVTPTTPTFELPANVADITTQERAILERIAQCESKGDITAVSSNGLYRGKYQFDRSTWKTVGGTGDPAAATEEEQDQRAAILLRQRGTAPWPVCGA